MNAKSLKQVNKYIQVIYPKVILVRGNGYYYISSDDDSTLDIICSLYTSSIPVCSIKQQTVESWVNDVKGLLNQNDKSSHFYQIGK